ncbi:MAG TPA: APC family permease [Allosphingosinicella sp.]|jgi:amino acid transporter
MSGRTDEPLRRDIGFFGSAFLSFNGVVGGGIFALPATLYTQFGSFSPFLFPLFGLLVLIVALPFARVAARHPLSGGPVVYAAAFGPAASFQAGWLYYVARATALAANATLLVTYLASWWPAVGGGWPRAGIIVAICALLTLVNIVGVRRAVRLLDALTLLKATPLIVAAVVGLAMAGAIEPLGPMPPLSHLEAAALLILFAFVGFENSVVAAGETADPRRTVPRALVATVLATAVLYFLIQLSYVAVMEPVASATPMVDFGRAVMGPAGAALLTAAAIFSLLGNISGGMTGTTRASYAMARDGLLPGWFGRVSERYATPANSILFMGALVALLALSGSFVWLAVVSTLARMFVYSISIASLAKGERPSPLLWAMMAAGIAVCAWAASQSKWESWRMLLILIAAGTLLYAIARAARRKA